VRWKAKTLERIVQLEKLISELAITNSIRMDGMLKVMAAAEMRIDALDPDSKQSAMSRRWLAGELIMIQNRLLALEHHLGLDAIEEKMVERMKQGSTDALAGDEPALE